MTMQKKRGRAALRTARLRALLCALLLAICAPSIGFAQETMHEISWAHATPQNVSRFVVYISATNSDVQGARIVDVGKPPSQPTSGGTMHVFRAIVSADPTEFVAVGAIGTDGSTSPLSAWSPLPPSQPGQPLLVP